MVHGPDEAGALAALATLVLAAEVAVAEIAATVVLAVGSTTPTVVVVVVGAEVVPGIFIARTTVTVAVTEFLFPALSALPLTLPALALASLIRSSVRSRCASDFPIHVSGEARRELSPAH